jgi:hydrogenase/urease accessory protein HupE
MGATCLLLMLAATAAAHTVGLSRGEYRLTADGVDVELSLARGELIALIPELDGDADGALAAAELERGAGAIGAALRPGVVVVGASAPCAGAWRDARLLSEDGVAVRLRYRCGSARAVTLPLLAQLAPGHRHLATVHGAAGTLGQQVLHARAAGLALDAAGGADAATNSSAALFVLGVEHILTGFDHLVFLLGLVLIAARWRDVLWTVTAFTLGHSLTLGLAVLGVWSPAPSLVEPAIALSVAYVGAENWFLRDAGRRWRLTLAFGLIHGFGFAGALGELEVPAAQVPAALAAFNVGVEAGQLAVLALVLPALAWLRRRAWFERFGVRGASGAIALAGLTWFAQRIA